MTTPQSFFRLLFFFLFLLPVSSHSQSSGNNMGKLDDLSRINLNVFIPEDSLLINGKLDPSACKEIHFLLDVRLQNILTQNGFGSSNRSPRFMVYPRVMVLNQELTNTAPAMYVTSVELVLFLADYQDKRTFSSISIPIRGVGVSPQKAVVNALREIRNNNSEIKVFLDEGKKNIIQYYNDQCDFILTEAEVLAQTGEYESAFRVLLQVPQACKECYMKAIDKVPHYYRQYIDFQCDKVIYEANVYWAAKKRQYENSQTNSVGVNNGENGANIGKELDPKKNQNEQAVVKVEQKSVSQDIYQAVDMLLDLPPSSSCYPRAQGLLSEIRAYVNDEKNFKERERFNKKFELDKLELETAQEIAHRYIDANAHRWEDQGRQTIINNN